MPTLEQMTQLQDAAQSILDLQPFDEIQSTIEAATQNAADEWWEARARKLPVQAALGHITGTRSIQKIQTATAPEAPASLSPYERYLAMTEAVDFVTANEILEEREQWPQTLQDAFSYFDGQKDRVGKFAHANPKINARRGKILAVLTADEIVVEQAAGNAKNVTLPHIVRQALRICMREEEVPTPAALAGELIANIGKHGSYTRLPGEKFHNLLYGRTLAQERRQALQAGEQPDIPTWSRILKQWVEQRTIHPDAYKKAQPLQETPDTEAVQIATTPILGHCAAQLYLRPYEQEVNAEHVTGFFASYGITLEGGGFRLVDYQLLRGIRAAEQTIFADKEYRAGLLAIAHAIRIA